MAKDNSFPTQTSTDRVIYTQSEQHHTNLLKTFRNTTKEPEIWYYRVISSNWITTLWTLTLRSSRQPNSLDKISQPRLRNRTPAFQLGWMDVQVGSGLPASCQTDLKTNCSNIWLQLQEFPTLPVNIVMSETHSDMHNTGHADFLWAALDSSTSEGSNIPSHASCPDATVRTRRW